MCQRMEMYVCEGVLLGAATDELQPVAVLSIPLPPVFIIKEIV